MSGYFANEEASREVLSTDGWLDTGDLGYSVDGALHITGRAKDLMIIKGRNIWPQDLEHLAEQQPEVRPTDSSAFSITDADDEEMAVLVVQTRETDATRLALLADRLQEKIHAEFGIQCLIELVVPHTLPRTSSGKLSRSSARKEFVERRRHENDESPTCFITDETIFRPVVAPPRPSSPFRQAAEVLRMEAAAREVEQVVRAALVQIRPGAADLGLDADLAAEAGLDSVEVMDMVMAIEDRLDLSIPVETLRKRIPSGGCARAFSA